MNIAENKVALFNHQILESIEAGIKLTGPEVKAIKNGLINLKGSYISIITNKAGISEAWLKDTHISKYNKAGHAQNAYEPTRPRKLLLNKREIKALLGSSARPGLTILPLLVYTSRGLVKIKIGLAKGKGQIDKRATIKKRELDRQVGRLVSR